VPPALLRLGRGDGKGKIHEKKRIGGKGVTQLLRKKKKLLLYPRLDTE